MARIELSHSIHLFLGCEVELNSGYWEWTLHRVYHCDCYRWCGIGIFGYFTANYLVYIN